MVKPANGKALNLDQIADFKQALHNSTIPIIVQVFGYDEVPPQFRATIEREHKVMLLVKSGAIP